ncbi:MAG TPA: hypothetical protein VFA37_09870 [Gaiellaceae bacterium]|nr:hypothetical protein [Gaiellaceae bacterium]
MRRVCLPALVLVCALVVAPPALAQPHFGKARTQQISTLVARFVNDVVRRRDLADGWRISGPAERGALTLKQWMSGRQLPVQQFDVLNDPRTAWYPKWKSGNEIGLVISLKTGHGRNAEMLQAESALEKLHGSWIVNSFYIDGIFRLGKGHSGSCVSSKCRVTGLADYAAGSGGGVALGKPKIAGHTVVIAVATIPAVLALAVLGLVWRVRRRDRRLRAAYYASRSS